MLPGCLRNDGPTVFPPFDAESAQACAKKFRDFFAAVRRDFGDPNLPFYFVQIGRFTPPPRWGKPDPSHGNAVQEVPRALPKKVLNTAVVYCNLVDARGMAVLPFGLIPVNV